MLCNPCLCHVEAGNTTAHNSASFAVQASAAPVYVVRICGTGCISREVRHGQRRWVKAFCKTSDMGRAVHVELLPTGRHSLARD